MTTNQIVLLLDICQGFSKDRHLGTLERDLQILLRKGLIDSTKTDWKLTDRGYQVANLLLLVGDLV
ncbi:MAG: hypothetical protein M0R80_13360 [Proteobacteria bacterium]|jgi:hypothetical protein|nr:hypothetical protein [Pseudomonadota bacterium]